MTAFGRTLGAIALCLATPGCGAAAPTDGKAKAMDGSMAARGGDIARRIGLALPPGARIEHAEYLRGQDDAARLAATMTQAEWTALTREVAASGPERPDFSADGNFHLQGEGSAWNPEASPGLATAQLPWRGGAESLNIGFAPAGDGRVRVFIFWHQL